MRRLILAVALVALAARPAVAAVTKVQGPTKGSTGVGSADVAVAYGASVTSGDVLIAMASWQMTTGTQTVSVTDALVSTWTSCTVQVSGVGAHYNNLDVQIWTATAASSGADTVTLHHGATHAGMVLSIYEVTPGTVGPCSGATGNSATPSAGSYTPSANGAYMIAICNLDDGNGFGSGWFTAGSGWTLGSQFGGGNEDGADEFQAQAAAAAVTGNFGSNFPSFTGAWAASIVSVVPSGGGGGGSRATGSKAKKLCALGVSCGA